MPTLDATMQCHDALFEIIVIDSKAAHIFFLSFSLHLYIRSSGHFFRQENGRSSASPAWRHLHRSVPLRCTPEFIRVRCDFYLLYHLHPPTNHQPPIRWTNTIVIHVGFVSPVFMISLSRVNCVAWMLLICWNLIVAPPYAVAIHYVVSNISETTHKHEQTLTLTHTLSKRDSKKYTCLFTAIWPDIRVHFYRFVSFTQYTLTHSTRCLRSFSVLLGLM